MANSNLRPISAAYRLLVGADQSKEEAERDVKQREWIWEFFLRNNSNGRLLTELLNAVPFPNENVYLKRLLLLRSLSLQLELKLFNEVTLDMLRALDEISRPSEGSLAGYRVQPVKKRKGFGKDNVETKISSSEAVKVNRRLPESRLVGKPSREGGKVEEELRHKRQKENVSLGRNLASSEVGGDRSEISSTLCEGPLWEMQLALMIEMTVKHLRGSSVSRKDFEAALMTYWGDVIIDTEEPVGECLSFGGKREEIRKELWKVRDNLDRLDEVTRRYTEERVRTMLSSFLEIAWAETQESFLEKVSKDVVNGVYNPQNPDVNRRSVRGVRGEDGAGMSREETEREKPFRRSSRGKVLRSRDKKQRALRLQIEDPEESEAEERIDPQNLTKRGETGKSAEPAGTSKLSGIQARLAEEPLQPTAENSHETGDKGAGIFDFKEAAAAEAEVEEFNHEETGRSQPCGRDRVLQEDINGVAEVGGPGDEDITLTRGEERPNANTSPPSPNNEGVLHNYTRSPHNTKGLSPGDQEISEKPCEGAKVANLEDDAVEVVDLSSPSPRPLDQFQGGFSPPPWVTSPTRSRKNLNSEFWYQPTKGTEVDTGNPRGEGTGAAEQPMEVSDPSSQTSREKNGLQRQGSAGVQVSSPKTRETRAASMKFNQRNGTACTFQWDEEDDISETRGSPQGSKRVSAGPISPPIPSRRTSSQSKLQRRKPRKWSSEETETLKNEVFKYGKGRWKLILANNAAVFDGRTEVDLKDKWRNLERFEGLSIPE